MNCVRSLSCRCCCLQPKACKDNCKTLKCCTWPTTTRNLHFALLSDFADAPAATMPEDAERLRAALERVRALNERYGADRFLFFHRRRCWNPQQGDMDGLGTQTRQTRGIQSAARRRDRLPPSKCRSADLDVLTTYVMSSRWMPTRSCHVKQPKS